MDYALAKAPFAPGHVFQGLCVEALIGHGGSAWVYRVRNTLTGDLFALKLIRNEPGSDMRRRTRDEFKLLEQLQHPNIVKVHTAGLSTDGRFVYIVMELLDGFALRDIATSLRKLHVAEVATLGAELCEAVHAAHSISIVHRDVKPENIFVLPDNSLKVLDFGLATLFGPRHVPTGRRWRGTPPYMSPEQLQGEVATPASDVYAIGLILYELACGAHYFYQYYSYPTLHLMAQVQLNLMPSPLSDMVPGFPKQLSDVIARAVEKDPAERFQSAAEFAAALRNVSLTLAAKAHQRGDAFAVRALVLETHRMRALNTQNQGSVEGISPLAPTLRAKTLMPAGKTLALSVDTNIFRNPGVLVQEWRTLGVALLLASLFAVPTGIGVAGALARIIQPDSVSDPTDTNRKVAESTTSTQPEGPISGSLNVPLTTVHIPQLSAGIPAVPKEPSSVDLGGSPASRPVIQPVRRPSTRSKAGASTNASRSVKEPTHSAVDLLDLFTPERRLAKRPPNKPSARTAHAQNISTSSEIIDPWASSSKLARRKP